MPESDTRLRPNDLYEQDFYAWTQEQARLLRERRWADLDLENLVDEVESVGRSDKRQIESRMEVLLGHLLKWKWQPGGRGGGGWAGTILEQRNRIAGLVAESPSLQGFAKESVGKMYLAGRLLASKEAGIAFAVFPEQCPWNHEQILDPNYWPEE